jgi:hypothetical protein
MMGAIGAESRGENQRGEIGSCGSLEHEERGLPATARPLEEVAALLDNPARVGAQ